MKRPGPCLRCFQRGMSLIKLILLIALLLAPPAFAADEAGIDLSAEARARGFSVFMQHCVACHGIKYYRGPENPSGIAPLMDAAASEQAFGVAAPDLSLMASARGKGLEGAEYIYRLLTTYYTTPEGGIRNRAFAEETHTDGQIAMPPPIPMDDTELAQKSRDVADFLFMVSEPAREERRSIGPWAVGFMVMLTVVLYALNRYTWQGLKGKAKG